MSGGGGQTQGNTTTVQKSDPWSGQQPYLLGTNASGGTNNPANNVPGILPTASSLYQQGGPQIFPGQTYAPATGAQNTAIQNQELLGAGGSPINAPAMNYGVNVLQGNQLNANTANQYLTPYANGSMMSAQNPYFQQMAQSTLASVEPGLADQFTQGNRMNSPGAAYGVSKGLGDAIGGLAYQNYQQGQGLAQNAASQIGANYNTGVQQQENAALLSPQIQSLPYNDATNLYNAGAAQQGLTQNTINDQLSRYNYQQSLPYNMLNWYGGAIGGNYGGTNTLTQPYFQQSGGSGGGWGGALGGAASGAAIGSMFGPYGTAIGAVGGGLVGGLSDRRMKENVRRVGVADNGLPIYTFTYKGDQQTHIGFMADEVEKIRPNAITEVAGLKYVNYELASR